MKARVLIVFILVVCVLSGCWFITEAQYEFRQEFDQIVSIEILKKQYDSINVDVPMDVIKTIDPAEHKDVIDALLAAQGSRVGLEPGTGFGVYIFRITYKNGEMEMIGDYNNGYITPNGEVHQGIYSFDSKQFYEVISRFLGEEVTPPTLG